MSRTHERCNTNEIICPHCDYEFGDSWELIPSNSDGEVCWEGDCPECENTFDISFDCRNVDDGFTSSVKKCKEGSHEYKLTNKLYESNYKTTEDISVYSRIEVCSVCDDYKFTPVKEDGSDFTKKEILDHKIKNRLKVKPKMYNQFNGKKTGTFKVTNTLEVHLKLSDPEGNISIWVKLCRWLITKGYKPQLMPDYLRKNSVSFKKGLIECDVSVHNYAVNVKFYQNEILKTRKKGDGRYEYDTYDIVDYKSKLGFRAVIHMVSKYFIKEGFEGKSQLTDYETLLDNLKVDKLEDWKDPGTIYNRDNEDRDKKIMKSGDEKYFYDRKVLKKGVIWWNNGNQWYVFNGGVLYYTSHYSLFDYQGEPKRKPLSKDAQVQCLYTELTWAEKSHNYDRCKVLWKMLESFKLYNVWSIKHGNWWGKNNGGYTPEKANAGVYTHENIMGNQSYYNDGVDSKAVLIQ